jgi:hypothetical protein
MKSIGKGAFGEVVLAKNSKGYLMLREKRQDICRQDHKQGSAQEEALPQKVYRPGNINHVQAQSSQHRQV